MRKVFVLTLMICALLASAASLLAHEHGMHLMGTVKAIKGASITIKTTAGQTTTVVCNRSTEFTKSGAHATIKDLHTGSRVVIHAQRSGKQVVATEVQFGKTPTKP